MIFDAYLSDAWYIWFLRDKVVDLVVSFFGCIHIPYEFSWKIVVKAAIGKKALTRIIDIWNAKLTGAITLRRALSTWVSVTTNNNHFIVRPFLGDWDVEICKEIVPWFLVSYLYGYIRGKKIQIWIFFCWMSCLESYSFITSRWLVLTCFNYSVYYENHWRSHNK